ncbi:MAG: hypothetical protein M1840_007604 [Geoglossum simile]|nr:MAG: hypothetical protein M1840_007604 [Geoglossum simile]
MTENSDNLPRAPPDLQFPLQVNDSILNDMTGTSVTEISEYKTAGFVVLKKRIDHTLVRTAREAVAKEIEAARKSVKGKVPFATVSEDKDWPHECKILFEAVENSVPPESFCPLGVKIRVLSRVGVYQPTNEVGGRASWKSVFYTIPLDVGALVSGVNMPSYYEGSYVEGSPIERIRESLTIEEGDILVWNGRTIMKNADAQSGGFMLIKHYWD